MYSVFRSQAPATGDATAPPLDVPQIIPAQSGVAFPIARGQRLRIVSPTGAQVADLFSVARDDPAEVLSSGRSIDYADRLYLSTGDSLYSNRSREMWRIVHDDVGRHDFTLTPCSPEMYRKLRGDDGSHPSCFDNLRIPMAMFGVDPDRIGSAFNIFMDVSFEPSSGRMTIGTPRCEPGDAIELLAMIDMIVGLTACSSELTNGGSVKEMQFVVSREP